jgi:flagellin
VGFRIQNNMAALNAHRNLGLADSVTARSLERLSSGFRINRAADDAAGLSVSQSFRADIASCKVAQRNVAEANAMLQVGEGALDQVGNMLTRMKELATQAASANSSSNLAKINAEYGKLMTEVDRVVNSTEYAGTKLLDGTLAARAAVAPTLPVPPTPGGPSTLGGITSTDPSVSYFNNYTQNAWMSAGVLQGSGEQVKAAPWATNADVYTIAKVDATHIKVTHWNGPDSDTIVVGGAGVDLVCPTLGLTFTNNHGYTATDLDGSDITVDPSSFVSMDVSGADGGTWTMTDDGAGNITIGNGVKSEMQAITYWDSSDRTVNFTILGISLTYNDAGTNSWGQLRAMQFTVNANPGDPGSPGDPGDPGSPGVAFQVGSENSADNRISISLVSAKTTDIGSGSGSGAASLNATDLSTASHAQAAMQVIDKAIGDVSTLRGNIGADQNCLSYEAANLSTTVENIAAADSVIRDTDMAGEMTSLTKNQILMQAGTAMLAQANTAPQQLLSLFRA